VLDGRPGASTLTLIARQEIEYLAPVPYLRQPLDVRLWLGKLGGASLDVCYEVYSPEGINDTERAAWTPYLDAPIEFARR
jgi:acyl-CoA thioester hydrolase